MPQRSILAADAPDGTALRVFEAAGWSGCACGGLAGGVVRRAVDAARCGGLVPAGELPASCWRVTGESLASCCRDADESLAGCWWAAGGLLAGGCCVACGEASRGWTSTACAAVCCVLCTTMAGSGGEVGCGEVCAGAVEARLFRRDGAECHSSACAAGGGVVPVLRLRLFGPASVSIAVAAGVAAVAGVLCWAVCCVGRGESSVMSVTSESVLYLSSPPSGVSPSIVTSVVYAAVGGGLGAVGEESAVGCEEWGAACGEVS